MGRIMGIKIDPCKRKRYNPTLHQKWIDTLKGYAADVQMFLPGKRDSVIILRYQDISELLEILMEYKQYKEEHYGTR